jgi:hypothetical protein
VRWTLNQTLACAARSDARVVGRYDEVEASSARQANALVTFFATISTHVAAQITLLTVFKPVAISRPSTVTGSLASRLWLHKVRQTLGFPTARALSLTRPTVITRENAPEFQIKLQHISWVLDSILVGFDRHMRPVFVQLCVLP